MVRVRSAVQIRSRAPLLKADMKISAFVLGGLAVLDPPDALFGFCFWGRGILNKVLKNSRQVRIMVGLILLLGQ